MKNIVTKLSLLFLISTGVAFQSLATETTETLKSEGDVEVCTMSDQLILPETQRKAVSLSRGLLSTRDQGVFSSVNSSINSLFTFSYTNMKSDTSESELSLTVIRDHFEKRVTTETKTGIVKETHFVRLARVVDFNDVSRKVKVGRFNSFHSSLVPAAQNQLVSYFKGNIGADIQMNCITTSKLK